MSNEESEEEEKEDRFKFTKKERKILSRYDQICKQIIEIAETLEKWKYKWDSKTIDGNTPLSLAA